MSHEAIDLPRPKVLQEALYRITERLAGELARPTQTAPDWSDTEWQLAQAVAAMHGVSALLAVTLKWDGPPHWRRFLDTQRSHVAVRHRRIEELLNQLDERAREQAVPLVGLKGVALHALRLYQPGERPMADVDLLVSPVSCNQAVQVLESLGFKEAFAIWRHKVFVPSVQTVHTSLGEHAQNYLKIELHERVAEVLPFRTTDVTDSVYPTHPHPGLNPYPSNAALMIHLLIHAANSMAYRALRLLHLHDIALLSTRMSSADWAELLRHGRSAGGPWWALPPLQLTTRYYGSVVPKAVLGALQNHCHWSLRRIVRHQSLSDVSLSYLWIEAFPGIVWSRSLGEMLEYVASRIRPSEEALSVRRALKETQAAVAHSRWGSLSQWQRMLRWITSRQPRVDTIHAVRHALRPDAAA